MRQPLRTCVFVALAAVAVIAPFPSLVAAPAQPPASSDGHLVLAVVRNDGIAAAVCGVRRPEVVDAVARCIGGPASPDLPANLASVPAEVVGWGRAGPLESLAARCRQRHANRAAVARDDAGRVEPPAWLPHRSAASACRPFLPSSCRFRRWASPSPGTRSSSAIATVSPLAPQWKTFTASLREEIDKAEERSIRTLRGSARWNHPFKPEVRAKVQPELEAWYSRRGWRTRPSSSPTSKPSRSTRCFRPTRAAASRRSSAAGSITKRGSRTRAPG